MKSKSIWTLLTLALVLTAWSIVKAEDKKSSPDATAVHDSIVANTKLLTPAGRMAFKTLVIDYNQVQQEIKDLNDAECKAQDLDPKDWGLNIFTGLMTRTAPAAPAATEKPAEKPTVKPADRGVFPSGSPAASDKKK